VIWVAEFLAMMPGQWRPHWTLRAIGQKHELRAHFPPSYVLAGSARAELVGETEGRSIQSPRSGYEAMWEHIAALVGQEVGPILPLDAILADLDFALDLADAIDLHLTGRD